MRLTRPHRTNSTTLRLDRLESRSSPALIWTGWDALDPLPVMMPESAGGETLAAPSSSEDPVSPPTTVEPTSDSTATQGDGSGSTGSTVLPTGPADDGQGDEGARDLGRLSYSAPSTGGRGQAPVITGFRYAAGNGLWTFMGHVDDDTPAGLTVRFGGAPESLQGQTAVTDANGDFSLTLSLQTNGNDAGTATTDTTDPDGNNSNTAECYVNP
jgi:hypothetical protein